MLFLEILQTKKMMKTFLVESNNYDYKRLIKRVFLVHLCLEKRENIQNKAGYTATQVACGWAGAVFEVS